ncbi:hypothetical protein ACFC26_14825 [Kitasatospora purpeofusca]|uniref:hypothetical protein n=1 Tax=Kitasatospora purpeofusca TaxID=67352 RepID=UPI0035DEAF94
MPLAEQHTDNPHTSAPSRSFYVLGDTAHVWNDIPGRDSVLAVCVDRDLSGGTFELDCESHALGALAEAWLVERGADPSRFTDLTEIAAADQETERIVELLRGAGPDRFAVHDQYTYDEDPYDVWVIATDTHNTGSAPVRVFHEQRQIDSSTYTLREGHFATLDDAWEWTTDPSSPLPPAPPSPSARAAAARPGTSSLVGGPVAGAPPAAAPAPRSRRR